MKKAAIFQMDLKMGGIEKSLYNLLHSAVLQEYEVDVFLFERNIFFNIQDLPSNIQVHYRTPFPYWCRFVPFEILNKLSKVKTDLNKEYDLAIDFSGYSQECAIYVHKLRAKRKVMWVHYDMEKTFINEWKYRVLFAFFKGKFKYYDCFAAVSEGIIEPFRRMSGCREKKVYQIPNIISATEIIEKAEEKCALQVNTDLYNLISVGRLCYAKGFDKLLDIISNLVCYRTDIKLYILGSGPLEKNLQQQIIKSHLSEYVEILPAVSNPYSYMSLMDGMILMSRYEGQGLVLSEAKILGLDLFFPKELEKYNMYMQGCEDVLEALKVAQKKDKKICINKKYDDYVIEQYGNFFSEME